MKALALWLVGLSACAPNASAPAAAPVKAAVVAKDGDLLTVTLTAEAVQRLALELAPVEEQAFPRSRTLGGEVVVPPGRTVTLVAPVAGRIGGAPLAPGARVAADQELFSIHALLTPEARVALESTRVEATGSAASARVQLDAAEEALQRAERMLADEVGSARTVAETRAQRDTLQAALSAAQARRDRVARVLDGRASELAVNAPFAGRVRALHAAPGQHVAAGAPLVEVVDATRVWIRVPIYVGELSELDADRPIALDGRAAAPVAAPPSANLGASTADRFYELANDGETLSPGQRVQVEVPLRGESRALAVPWSAIVHDTQGGTWVYECTAPETFVRRRVEVARRVGERAELAKGPPPGARIVRTGAAELYGTEFGHAK